MLQTVSNVEHRVESGVVEWVEKQAMANMKGWLAQDLIHVLRYYASKASAMGEAVPEELEGYLKSYLSEFKSRLNALQFAEIVEYLGMIQAESSA